MTNTEIFSEVIRCLEIEAAAIEALSASLDPEATIAVAKAIANCKGKVITTGCGTSAAAAKKIAHSLCCVERPALFLSPSDSVHGGLGVVQSEDVVIMVSKGGNTGELVKMVPACHTKKALLIAVSENEESTLAKEADIYLKVKVDREPCRFNMLATASTLAVISAFDGVCLALMLMTGYTKEQFGVIHPSGAVGQRLLSHKD